jgi:glutathione S-transferase
LYPKDPQQRAIINHRLCFNSSFFYTAVAQHVVGPMFFDYPQTEMGLKRLKMAIGVFDEYLRRLGKKYVAGDQVTIADISLACSMTVLEAIQFNLNDYSLVKEWYQRFKNENQEMWQFPGNAITEMVGYAKNPPDMSKLYHPFHPKKKIEI